MERDDTSKPPWLGPRSLHGGVDEVPLPGVPGRLWLAGKHFVGPDVEAALRLLGATTVVSLNEAHELRDRYPDYLQWLEGHHGGRAVWHPIPDLHAPPVPAARALVADLGSRVRVGEGLLLHCGAGIGRAGTVAVALLMHLGVSHPEALETVAAHRPTAGPEAGGQVALLEALRDS